MKITKHSVFFQAGWKQVTKWLHCTTTAIGYHIDNNFWWFLKDTVFNLVANEPLLLPHIMIHKSSFMQPPVIPYVSTSIQMLIYTETLGF